ncbi:hypothetical protein DY000_02010243 [Brassica cretica]|uniref:Protein YIP n=1 Tax=Brassica cretica TaxID=69181 RepID=A0ABQ7BYL5_BRACR|nr:hypothetical protein DY000_02010243 [Brassica cretica]
MKFSCGTRFAFLVLFPFAAQSVAVYAGSFHKDVKIHWGDGRGKIRDRDGKLLSLSLDKSSGSGFQSNQEFLYEVFAVAFALLAAGAVILTLNVLLLGGHIIFFQSLSLLGYCLFPLDVGAVICMLKDNVILKMIVVTVTLAWSSWAAYPFMSAAVNPRRKALALYPVFLMYVSVGFLIIAID